MSQIPGAPGSPRLADSEVRKRASAGVLISAAGSIILLVVGLGGTIVLARLLTPHDFGIYAYGATALLITSAFAEGGLASGLIRRPEHPTVQELRTLSGIQLLITGTLTLIGCAIALQFGRTGQIASVMLLAIPLSSFQAPGRVVLYRQLLFSRLTTADILSTVANYAWAIPVVLLGGGVWGMATGAVVKALVSAVCLLWLSPISALRPSLRGAREFKQIVWFGIKYQASWVTFITRDQLLNVFAGSVAGTSQLGQWSLARRLMELPMGFVDAVHRVSYPALAHLLAKGDDPTRPLEKAVRSTGVLIAILTSSFGAASLAIVPAVMGAEWTRGSEALPIAALGVLVGQPVVATASSFIFATARPGAVLRSTVVSALAWIAVSLALLPFIGVLGVAAGWIAGSLVEVAFFNYYVKQECRARVARCNAAAVACGLLGGAIGCLLVLWQDRDLWTAFAGGALAPTITVAALLVVRRDDVVETLGHVVGAVANAARVRFAKGTLPT